MVFPAELARPNIHASDLLYAEQLHRVFEHGPVGIALVGSDLTFVEVNPALCRLLDRTRDELVGLTYAAVTHPDDLDLDVDLGRQLFAGEIPSYRIEKRYVTPRGETVWVDLSAAVLRDERGTPVLGIAIVQDSTERKRAEVAAERRAAAVRLLQEVAVAANTAPTVEDALQVGLDAICSYTGWTAGHAVVVEGDETVPAGVWSGAPPAAVRHSPPAFVLPLVAGETTVGALELFGHAPGQPDDALLSVMPNIGMQLGRAIERQRTEAELVRLARARADFVAHAAHELRGPVAAVTALSSVLAEQWGRLPADDAERAIRSLDGAADRLRTLVDRLLDLSWVERPGAALEVSAVDLRPAVDRAVAAVAPTTQVRLRVPAACRVLADGLALDEVLVNLIGNAVRHGGGSVWVTAHREGEEIVVTVRDEGPGVPVELEGRLFEPFARGARTGGARGAGLGLAISRRLATVLGGELGYRRRAGGGAAFELRLRSGAA